MKCDFRSVTTKGISSRIRENFKRTVIGGRAEDMLDRIGIFGCLRRDRCDIDAIGHKETTIKPKTECANKIALCSAISALRLCKKIGGTGLG
jgi:hypothetical protein